MKNFQTYIVRISNMTKADLVECFGMDLGEHFAGKYIENQGLWISNNLLRFVASLDLNNVEILIKWCEGRDA